MATAGVLNLSFAPAEGVARGNELEHATLLRTLIGTIGWPIARATEERGSIRDEVRNEEDVGTDFT
jgi:hypothetical protein